MIYLDNAATTGHKPLTVVNAVNAAMKNLSANPGRSGHTPSERAAAAVFDARLKAAEFFGASGPERVVFTSNCTHSINVVIKGAIKKGEHIIVSSLEHNAVMRPLVKSGVDFDVAEVSFDNDDETVENFRRLIRRETRMIFVTAASNVVGKCLPIKKLGALCRERGLFFGVDAAQTAGIIPLNMQQDGIDFLCVAPHKGLYAPMGIGLLIAEKDIQNTLIEGGTGVDSLNINQPDVMPERLESGTVNVPAVAGLSAGIGFVKEKGLNRIYSHEMRLVQMLYDRLEKMPHIILYTPRPTAPMYAPVLSFNAVGKASSDTARYLNAKGIAVRAGLHCAPTAHRVIGTLENGCVRVCPSVFNSEQDILQTAAALRMLKN